jgi:hypothetical protein
MALITMSIKSFFTQAENYFTVTVIYWSTKRYANT